MVNVSEIKPRQKKINFFIEFFVLFIVLAILRIGVSFITSDKIEVNVKKSYNNIVERGNYAYLPSRTSAKDQLDYWTENRYISESLNVDKENPIRSAMRNSTEYDSKSNESGGGPQLISRLEGRNDSVQDRTQYWHGAVVILKPLLLFFSYEQIMDIVQGIFWCSFLWTIIAVYNRLGSISAAALALGLINVNVIAIPMLLHTGLVFFISMGAICFIVKKFYNNDDIIPVMVCVGVLTSYFDWMSTPIVTFALPTLIAIMCAYKNDNLDKIADGFWLVFKSGAAWAISYFAMLFGKWVLASIILGENVIAIGVGRASNNITNHGTGIISVPTSFFEHVVEAFKRNLSNTEIFSLIRADYRLATFVIIFIITIVLFVISVKKYNIPKWLSAGVWLLITSLAPLAWIVVFKGHTYIHFFFTYRQLSATIMGIILVAAVSIEKIIKSDNI